MTHLRKILPILVFGFLVFFPDVVLSSIMECLHLTVELAHLLFEVVELSLDHIIEHLFETDLHETQVIVFYIMMVLCAIVAYGLWLVTKRACIYCKLKLVEQKNYRQEQLHDYWLHQDIMHKISIVVLSVGLVMTYLLFFM